MRKFIRTLVALALVSLSCALFAQNKYALFVVGDHKGTGIPAMHQWNNGDMGVDTVWMEFWNDAFLYWEMLTSGYKYGGFGYHDFFTQVLFADGYDYKPPGYADRYSAPQSITDGAATKTKLVNYLEYLASGDFPLTNDDFLFIWTMGHGGYSILENDYIMYLYNSENQEYITAGEFSALVNNINAGKKVIFMQQGYAGGFAPYFFNVENTIFYSSSDSTQNAHRANDTPYLENEIWDSTKYYHGEFNFHTYSPVRGESPGYDS
jgi:hypothetical protein